MFECHIRHARRVAAVLGIAASLLLAEQPPGEQIKPVASRTVMFRVRPEYPRIAASMNLVGSVQLQASVRPDGTVKEIKVLGGHPVLVEAAVTALKQWRYEPGPKETVETIRISFGK